MVAYNEGLLDAVPSSEIPALLERLAQWVRDSGLGLEDKREEWKHAVKKVIESHGPVHTASSNAAAPRLDARKGL
jgi:hypothetical protein